MTVTCPYCGTSYLEFQPNCDNCGGVLPAPEELARAKRGAAPAMPPPAPREIKDSYAWKLLLQDGLFIASGVFALVGGIFTLVGGGLTLGIVTAFVGLPFLGIGLLFVLPGGYFALQRYDWARKQVRVLREGLAAVGEIVDVEVVSNVQVNGRNPWKVLYLFRVDGEAYEGEVTTLRQPELMAGDPAAVLYLASEPEVNGLWPRP